MMIISERLGRTRIIIVTSITPYMTEGERQRKQTNQSTEYNLVVQKKI
jgi:hypothetical protein